MFYPRRLSAIFSALFLTMITGCAGVFSTYDPPPLSNHPAALVTKESSAIKTQSKQPAKDNSNVPNVVSDKKENSGSNIDTAKNYQKDENIDKNTDPQVKKNDPPTNQELIDSAGSYWQASYGFWEKGDLDNAVHCLDKAYSLILKANGSNDPEIQQEKEDLRIAIAKTMLEVYSSRLSVAKGLHTAIPLAKKENKHVKEAIKLFQGKDRKFFLEAYARSGRYRPMIVRMLKKAGLPPELSWLPLIESGYKLRAFSKARALGMWQFIASTGYKYGLMRNTWIDERMDPEKSTKAAIAYLTELHQIFGDWKTALASYNCGEVRVSRVIKSQKVKYLDDFWDLYNKLPTETAFYVPKFLAVLHILKDPKAYGFTLPPLDKELKYEKVKIDKQLTLKTIAKTMNENFKLLMELNPELRRNVTPKTAYELKVPAGKAKIFMAKLKDIPAYHPPVPEYIVHRVHSGESLSVIADRYNTSVRAIMNMNNLGRRNFLRAGWKLKVPTGRHYVPSSYSSGNNDELNITKYIVRKGDSLWKIANQFNTTVQSIKSANGLDGANLSIGQALTINQGNTDIKPGDPHNNYTVRKGDSPYIIAKRYGMNLYDFLRVNNLTPVSTIFPGQKVKVIPQ